MSKILIPLLTIGGFCIGVSFHFKNIILGFIGIIIVLIGFYNVQNSNSGGKE